MDEDLILETWKNPKAPGSYTSVSGFLRNNPQFRDVKKVKKVLENIESFSIHKPIKRKKIYPKVISNYKSEIFGADLIDYSNLKGHNSGKSYILVVICTFSRYTYLMPLVHKSADSLTTAFRKLFTETGQIPKFLWFDEEKAITGKKFKALMKEFNIKLYHTFSVKKVINLNF
jgi:hypothetical protein